MTNKGYEREMNKMLEDMVRGLFRTGLTLFRAVYWGGRGLNTKKKVLPFLMVCIVPAAGYFVRDYILSRNNLEQPVRYLIYAVLLLSPLLYLIIIGKVQEGKQGKYKKIFKEIGFQGKDNKFPYLIAKKKENNKLIYIFQSNISLEEWRNAKGRLETGLNCNILSLENGSNKRLVKVTTVPGNCRIPEYITWSDEFLKNENGEVVVGQGAVDRISFNLNRLPHVLIAGETGSGKSVILRTFLWQMINQGAKIYMIDFKGGVEFGKKYERYGEVITERERALKVLGELVVENEKRLHLFRDLEVKNLKEYNAKTKQNLCRICIFSDEIAEMLDKKGIQKEERKIFEQIEAKISTLARLSRATGINLFIGVQRPDANVLTGQIKNNIPVRISGRFADKPASEIVLGNTSAVELPDIKGRFLYKVGNDIIEFQSYYFDDDTMLKEIDIEVGEMLTNVSSYERKVERKKVETKRKSEAEIKMDFDYEDEEDKPFA